MTKVTQELPMKFFLSYEDAVDDLVFATCIVEVEIQPEHTLYKTLIMDSLSLSSLGRNVMMLTHSENLKTGVFKLRTLQRANFLGEYGEQVYILESLAE